MPTQRFRSDIVTLEDLKNPYVYILRSHKFYGKEPDTGVSLNEWELKEYSYEDVKQEVMNTLGLSSAFMENAITENTTLLIVPDDWDRKLPKEIQHLSKHLIYLPFSYILHPKVINPSEMMQLKAPPDAAYYIMLREQNRTSVRDSFELGKVAPDEIMERFQGWRFGVINDKAHHIQPFTLAAATPDMGIKKSSSINPYKRSLKKTSVTMKGNANTMGVQKKTSKKKPASDSSDKVTKTDAEYEEAWQSLLAHARKIEAHRDPNKKTSLTRRQ